MPLHVFSADELTQRPSFITVCHKFQSFSVFYCYRCLYFLPYGFPMSKSMSSLVPSNGKQGRPRPYDIHSTLLDHSLRSPGLCGVPFSPDLKHFKWSFSIHSSFFNSACEHDVFLCNPWHLPINTWSWKPVLLVPKEPRNLIEKKCLAMGIFLESLNGKEKLRKLPWVPVYQMRSFWTQYNLHYGSLVTKAQFLPTPTKVTSSKNKTEVEGPVWNMIFHSLRYFIFLYINSEDVLEES